MIRVSGLGYRDKKFVMEGIDFSLEDGYILTLLGRNGAGKTTLLDLIFGALQPSEGRVYWNGTDVTGKRALETKAGDPFYREDAAYVGDKSWCLENLSAAENIEIFCRLYPRWKERRFREILNRLEFTDALLQQSYRELSSGQKMQLQIAFCLAREPKLLLLDEPMANLDPVVKTDLWELLSRRCREENMGILISTHLVEEVHELTDYIGILKDGRMTAFGESASLLSEYGCGDLRTLVGRLG